MSKFAETLPEEYGYVLLTATGSIFVNMWMAINVTKARKKFSVEVMSRLSRFGSANLYYHQRIRF